MKNRHLVIGPGKKNSALNQLFYEVITNQIDDAEFADPYVFNNRFIRKLYNFRYSDEYRKYFTLVPNSLWRSYSTVNKIELADDEKLYIYYVIGRDVERLYDPVLLHRIKDKYGSRVTNVLLLLDSIDVTQNVNGWNNITSCFKDYDYVGTFDLKDANKYGIQYFTDPYCPRCVPDSLEFNTDIFFVGVDKGRASMLVDIAKKARDKNLTCDFRIFGAAHQDDVEGIKYIDKFLPYEDTLRKVKCTECLLEILAEGQSSSSLRYYEAVVYNKRLLTNNQEIKHMQFYRPDYIQVFDTVADINFEWIKKKEKVDYGYKDEFSVSHLFDMFTLL